MILKNQFSYYNLQILFLLQFLRSSETSQLYIADRNKGQKKAFFIESNLFLKQNHKAEFQLLAYITDTTCHVSQVH